jgi:hypothetical protein
MMVGVAMKSFLSKSLRRTQWAILAICVLPCCILAQSIRLQHPPYVESFVGKPKVSGNLLVGLRFGEASGKFNPSAVGLLIPPRVGWRSACVDISSRDGLYFAQNMYEIDGASGGLATIQAITKYSDELLRYKNEDIAVTVRLVSDCNAPEVGELVPAILNASSRTVARSPNLSLVALVNAEPDRLKVALLRNGVEASIAECKSDSNAVQISFTSSCEFKASTALAPGNYDLLIRVRERFASRDSHFAVHIP